MIHKSAICFLYFLYLYYYSEAFYKPFTNSFCHKKMNNYYLSKSNNNEDNYSEINIANKTINKNLRLGRSKDEDGRSNIWSVEPKMQVVDEEITEVNKNILTGGLVITGFLVTLPVLYTLNQYIQKIDY